MKERFMLMFKLMVSVRKICGIDDEAYKDIVNEAVNSNKETYNLSDADCDEMRNVLNSMSEETFEADMDKLSILAQKYH